MVVRILRKVKYDEYDYDTNELKEFIKFNSGNNGLTRHFIYKNLPSSEDNAIRVISPSKEKFKIMGFVDKDAKIKNKNLKIYNGETILLVRKGNAGKMHYYNNYTYTVNEDAYVLTIKEKYKDKINLQWFSYYFQKLFYNLATAKGGNGTISKSYAEEQIINIPDIKIQEEELSTFIRLENYLENLDIIENKIDNLLERIIVFDDENTDAYSIKDTFYLDTGRRIVQKELYEIIDIYETNHDNIIPIYSSGIENEGLFGHAPIKWLESEKFIRKRKINEEWEVWKNEIGESFIIDEPCITWNTDGDAGTLFYRDYKFFPTDHCGVLIPKENYIDKINLKFFKYSQQYNFKQATERGNLHKKKMASQTFELPEKEVQDEISNNINKLVNIKLATSKIKEKINNLLKVEIV